MNVNLFGGMFQTLAGHSQMLQKEDSSSSYVPLFFLEALSFSFEMRAITHDH